MKEIFNAIDTDKSNSLTLGEVVLFLKSITDDLSEENIERIFNGIDSSGDKMIDFMEFKKMIKEVSKAGWRKVDSSEGPKEEDLRALFDMIDRDRSGSLSMRVQHFFVDIEASDKSHSPHSFHRRQREPLNLSKTDLELNR